MSIFKKNFWKQSQRPSDIRIFYASDIHGSEQCFIKFVNAGKFYDVNVLILGGDLTGKRMVPLINYEDGHWETDFLNVTHISKSDQDLNDLEKNIRFNGMYPYRCDTKEFNKLTNDLKYRDKVFKGLIIESIQRWVSIADTRLKGTGIKCYVMPGNDDIYEIDNVLSKSDCIINPNNKLEKIDNYQLISMAECNPTPWNSPREESEEQLTRRLQQLVSQIDLSIPVIFNLHAPPYNSTLDLAPTLTKDLKVITEGSGPRMSPVGSKAVREIIEKVQPIVSLHGHVHESKAYIYIGKTLCINPGSEYHDGVLHGVIVSLLGKEVQKFQLISG